MYRELYEALKGVKKITNAEASALSLGEFKNYLGGLGMHTLRILINNLYISQGPIRRQISDQ